MTNLNLSDNGDAEGSPPVNWNETLYGTSYAIAQYTGWAADTAVLRFALPVTITSDVVSGNVVRNQFATQTDSFSIMNLDSAIIAWDARATFSGSILSVNGEFQVADASASINTNVLGGSGPFVVTSGGAVNVNSNLVTTAPTFELSSGSLTIAKPNGFYGNVDLGTDSVVSLAVGATSYSYANNVLTLWNGGTQVDNLKLADSGSPVAVYKTASGQTLVTNNPNVAGESGVQALPVHGDPVLNFGPGTVTEQLTDNSYTINEAATEYSGATQPANVTLDMTNPNVTVGFHITGGVGDASGEGEYVFPATLSVNFANRLTITGDYGVFAPREFSAANVTLTGPMVDNEAAGALNASHVQINADLVGTGSWDMWTSDLTVGGSVSAGQCFNLAGGSNLNIDAPGNFQGAISLAQSATVSLVDLTATSYGYVNNIMSLYNGNNAVAQFRFSDSGPFEVYRVGGSISIDDGARNPAPGIALPQHSIGV